MEYSALYDAEGWRWRVGLDPDLALLSVEPRPVQRDRWYRREQGVYQVQPGSPNMRLGEEADLWRYLQYVKENRIINYMPEPAKPDLTALVQRALNVL